MAKQAKGSTVIGVVKNKKAEKTNNGYKLTKLGRIPIEWQVRKLGDIAIKIGSGITPKGGEEVYTRNGRPFVRSQNVGWGKLLLEDVAYIDEKTHQSFQSTEIKENDILLNITGASIGRCAVVDERVISGNVNQHVCIIRIDTRYASPFFINYFLLSKHGQNLIESYQAGGNRQGLNFEQIRSFFSPIPPLSQQQKIAHILNTWDKAIEKTEFLIEKKQQLKKGLMQELLTGKKRLHVEETKTKQSKIYKDSKLGRIPVDWEVKRLGDLGFFLKGKGILREQLSTTGLPCVRYGEIYTTHDYIIKEFKSFIKRNIALESEPIFNNDILFAGSGETLEDIGKAIAYVGSEEAFAGGDIVILRTNKEINAEYLAYSLNTGTANRQKRMLGQGHSVVHIYSSDLSYLIVPLPSPSEQKRIAQVLQAADNEIESLKNALEKLKLQKRGLMQKLLTGEIRVKN